MSEEQQDAGALDKTNVVLPKEKTTGFWATPEVILWDWYYEPGMLVDTPRKQAGVRVMKSELIFNGFKGGVIVDVMAWGDAVTNQTKAFQTSEGIQADGRIGRVTARHLFRRRASIAAQQYGIPDDLVAKVKTWESANDPVCHGISADEGIVQISPPNHPELSIAFMWDPARAIPWAAGYLKGAFIYCGDWDGAVAGYNIGGGLAKKWVDAGKPASGGPTIGTNPDGSPLDAWVRATTYVANVRQSLG